jgi:cell division protein FtsB
MNDTQPPARNTYRAVIAVLILIAVGLLTHEIFGQNGYLALRQQRQQYEALQNQIKQLQEENQQLEKLVKALKSDPKAIEKLARDNMHLARPGEIIYTLPDKDAKSKPPTTPKKSAPPQ